MQYTRIVAALAATAARLAVAPGARAQALAHDGTAPQMASTAMDGGSSTSALAGDVLTARQATARFATGLEAAKAAGYRIITLWHIPRRLPLR